MEPASGRGEEFVSEAIIPIEDSFASAPMVRGEPSLPKRFRWRDCEYSVSGVLDSWKSYSTCKGGSAEKYLRKHWYRVRTADGLVMKIYFERQPRPGQSKKRWWLATVVRPEAGPHVPLADG